MSYLVAVHDGGGSMAEGMEPRWTAIVSTREEAVDLENKIWDHVEGTTLEDEGLVVITKLGDPLTVDDAFENFKNDPNFDHFLDDEDDEDPDEAALNAKVDGLMKGETDKLNGLFKDTYHKPERQTYIEPDRSFTRYPTEDSWAPYQGVEIEEEDFGDDPFGDMSNEELAALSDEEFVAILRKSREEREDKEK